MSKETKIFKTLTEEKIDEIEKILFGLDSMEWGYIASRVNMYFSKKAANIKIDDLKDFDMLMKSGY